MIEGLFSSTALYRTLALFFEYPEEPVTPRLISRHTGTGMKSVLREIRKPEQMGSGNSGSRIRLSECGIGRGDGEEEWITEREGRRRIDGDPPSVRMWEKEKGRRSGGARRPVKDDRAGGVSPCPP